MELVKIKKISDFIKMVVFPILSSVICLSVLLDNITYYRQSGSATECIAFMISALMPITLLILITKSGKVTSKISSSSKWLVVFVLLYVLLVHPLLSIFIFLPIEVWHDFVALYSQ